MVSASSPFGSFCLEINVIHITLELPMGAGWDQGPMWINSNKIHVLQRKPKHTSHLRNTKVMVNQTLCGHGSHIQTINHTHTHTTSSSMSISLIHYFSFLLFLYISHTHTKDTLTHTCNSLCHSLTDISQLSQVELLEGRGFAFVFFQYLLWTEDHELTMGKEAGRTTAAQHPSPLILFVL